MGQAQQAPAQPLARRFRRTQRSREHLGSGGAGPVLSGRPQVRVCRHPTITVLDIPVFKEALWMLASFEEIADTRLSDNIPALISDARDRLEASAFAVGTGTVQPWGVTSTHATSDSATGALDASKIYGLHKSLPPRYRNGGDPVWMANVAMVDSCRQIAKFSGAVESIVEDGGPVPRMLGSDFLEASAVSSGTATGSKNLV